MIYSLKCNDLGRLKVERWKKIYHAFINLNNSKRTPAVSDKVDFRAKKITRDREGCYMMINGSMYQEDKLLLNVWYSKHLSYKI